MSTSKPSKPPTNIPPTSSLHTLAITTGTYPLTIGNNTYIHLRAHLTTTHGPLTIGSHCIISEKASVGYQSHSHASNPNSNNEEEEKEEKVQAMILSDHIVIEPKAQVEASQIGEGTVVETGARIGRGAVVGKYCTIGALCSVGPYEDVPDHTVIYGNDERRIDRSGTDALRAKRVEQHVEVLKKAELAARKK
ncbi:MAG: hypothetical protein Q9172_000690 [Xanthocarpia lactea]